ncbi:MAG: GNAT family N-acetyltransferase [Actinomycetota bacterium]
MSGLRSITDGLVVIRTPESGDADLLIAGRDDEFHRFLGPGADDPCPTGCMVVGGTVVGWVDFDTERAWLEPGEVNVGYNVFAAHRGLGYASRAVKLLLHHLAVGGEHHTATLLIHPNNTRSLALARRSGFALHGHLDGNPYWKRAVPPLSYSDGTVNIRRRDPDDLAMDLAAKDDEQIRWLWQPGEREAWAAMTPHQQQAHALRDLQEQRDRFGAGPKWTFTIDAASGRGVGYVDCDLANQNVPRGEANISYACHPAYRGRGFVSRAVRLVTRFLADHTGARTAHIIIDHHNSSSLRVARSVQAARREQWTDDLGRTMVRHTLEI